MIKAIRFHQFGGSEVLVWEDIMKPASQENELLLKVISAGVNPIDTKIRAGTSFACQKLALPSSLGFELCGEIVSIGSSSDCFQIGDIVFGTVGRYFHPAAYSEYCVVKMGEMIKKPVGLSSTQAAALPIAGTTAWQALYDYGNIQPNERVLIHAAAGGVGHLAAQLAKQAGAYVIATASKQHHSFLQQLGVDEIIDYTQQPFYQVINNIDLVIDLVGGETATQSFCILSSSGRLVTVPTYSHEHVLQKAKAAGINASTMLANINIPTLMKLSQLAETNQLSVHISDQFQLSDAKSAHEKLEEKHAQGKIVLVTGTTPSS